MKKLLIIITLLTGLSTVAQAMNPVQKAKVQNYLEISYPLVKSAMVCNFENKFEYLEETMRVAYKLGGAHDEWEKTIIDMLYSTAEMDFEFGGSDLNQVLEYIKQNPKAQDSKYFCNEFKKSFETS